jgi:hypothetical protein
MKSTKVAAAFAAGIAVGCAAAPVVERAVTPAYAQNASGRRFEQFCTSRGFAFSIDKAIDEINADLKQKGDGGWELVNISASGGPALVYCFKRPAP